MMKMFLQKPVAALRRAGIGLIRRVEGLRKDCSAGTAMVFAICLVPLMLAIGGAVDFSRYYDARESIQAALDSSVLAGAAKNSATIAADTFNAWKVNVAGTSVTVSSSNYTGCTSSDTTCTGTISTTIKTYFSALVGIRTLTLHVISVAEKTGTTSASGSGCVWVTGNNGGKVNVNGGTLNASGCQVNSKSTNDTVDAKMITPKFCTATPMNGGTISNAYNNKTVTDSSGASSLYVSCTPPDVPYVGKFSAPSNAGTGTCISVSATIEKDITLNPGVYCSAMTVQNGAKITLNPGIYILKGASWLFNSGTSLTGTGVTFYLMYANLPGTYNDVSWCNRSYDWCWSGKVSGVGSIHFNGNATSTLSAVTSSTATTDGYACSATGACGVLMYGDNSAVSGTMDSANATWTGIVYLPYQAMTFNGGSNAVINGTLVLAALTSSENLTVSNGASGSSSTSIIRLKK